MPKFLWVLRDFTLELENEYGVKQTPRQYLESVLTEQNNLVRNSEEVKRVRRSLLTYFKSRDCMVLVRPAKEEYDLQRLDKLPDHGLRREFVDGVNNLRTMIMNNAGPKTYDGEVLYGGSIAAMIENYVETINKDGIPNIKTAWEHISEDEGAYAYNRAIERYNELYQEAFPDDEPKD